MVEVQCSVLNSPPRYGSFGLELSAVFFSCNVNILWKTLERLKPKHSSIKMALVCSAIYTTNHSDTLQIIKKTSSHKRIVTLFEFAEIYTLKKPYEVKFKCFTIRGYIRKKQFIYYPAQNIIIIVIIRLVVSRIKMFFIKFRIIAIFIPLYKLDKEYIQIMEER